MRPAFLQLVCRLMCLINREDGQDLIEYALLAFLIACAATASIGQVSAGIAPAFNSIANKFSSVVAVVGA